MVTATDVVIAGAGPVGLTLAIELNRRGIATVLLEQKTEPSYYVVECADAVPRELIDVRGIAASQASPPPAERILWLTDAAGQFRRAYGATGAALWLTRPDGYVGYRAAPVDAAKLGAYLRRILR